MRSETPSVFRELGIFIKSKFSNAFVPGKGENDFKTWRIRSYDQKVKIKNNCLQRKVKWKCLRALNFISYGRKGWEFSTENHPLKLKHLILASSLVRFFIKICSYLKRHLFGESLKEKKKMMAKKLKTKITFVGFGLEQVQRQAVCHWIITTWIYKDTETLEVNFYYMSARPWRKKLQTFNIKRMWITKG